MNPYLAEFMGTAILVLMGNGVVANVSLKKSKGFGGGWVTIAIAWGLAVFCGVIIAGPSSGAHLNPAVTFSNMLTGAMTITAGLLYIASQMVGALLGATLVYAFYKDHFDATEDPEAKMGAFCTSPAIRKYGRNFFSELLGTFVLVLVILFFGTEGNTAGVGMGSLGAIPVAFLIIALGMSLGGTTGYAINPARDLGPRIMHAILPIKGKRDSDWSYSWVPVLGPLSGGALATLVYILVL